MPPASRPRPRPAHTTGITRCAYTPDGKQLITVGANNTIRLYETGSDGEPTNLDDVQDNNVCVAATNDFFVVGCEDGSVSLYSLDSHSFESFLVRTTAPVRDVSLSPDGQWCAVASDEYDVRVINTKDNMIVRRLRAHNKPAKHVSFDPKGRTVSVACNDGIIYVYSMMNGDGVDDDDDDSDKEEAAAAGDPVLISKIDGIIGSLDPADEASNKMAWHPDGRSFAVATPTRDIQVVGKYSWDRQHVFASGHEGAITALAWAPNGAMLASAGKDGKIVLWETRTQSVVKCYEYGGVLDLAWHPTKNLLSFTNSEGEVYICPNFVTGPDAPLLCLPIQSSPLMYSRVRSAGGIVRLPRDPVAEAIQANRENEANQAYQANQSNQSARVGILATPQPPRRIPAWERRVRPAPIPVTSADASHGGGDDVVRDSVMSEPSNEQEMAIVEDDNFDGYMLRGRKEFSDYVDSHKRAHDGSGLEPDAKRVMTCEDPKPWKLMFHPAFHPSASPWRNNRRYLCLNLVGIVWIMDQGDHHTVTVEFNDQQMHRNFHFTDPFRYDKACLTERGTLFTCAPRGNAPAKLFFRPHESWTEQRSNWQQSLPVGESVVSMALTTSFSVVLSSAGFVRIYTQFGLPHRVYRAKNTPLVSCAAWKEYVWTLANGPMGSDGTPRLVYTIYDVKKDQVIQNEDYVALPGGQLVQSMFFSEDGDPCIYDTDGSLATLVHWQEPSRAYWVPVLDTKAITRTVPGLQEETYFPIAVSDRKFHCMIVKGSGVYPPLPPPPMHELDFEVPNEDGTGPATACDEGTMRWLENSYMVQQVALSQLRDRVDNGLLEEVYVSGAMYDIAQQEADIDKTLLQMLSLVVREGEGHGMRAMDIVRRLKDTNGQMVEAAAKIAERYDQPGLLAKMEQYVERREQVRSGQLDAAYL